MKIDEYGVIVREQYEPAKHPGNLGDSCADTARVAVLSLFPKLNLHPFRTVNGYIRHPDVPQDWKETDFTSDQATPLLMAFDTYEQEYPEYASEMRARLKTNRTGNGKLVSPGLWTLVRERLHLLGFITLLQAILFLVPLRWNDSHADEIKHWWQRIQWGGDEGDYLNWIPTLEYLWARDVHWPTFLCYMLRSPGHAALKVVNYHANQPNSDLVVGVYLDHLNVTVKRRI